MSATYPIESVPLFPGPPPSQLEPLKESAVRLLYRPGEAIFLQGDLPQYLYIVEEGEVDIVLPAQGEELILASFQSGSFFGELAVFDNQPRSAAARACVDTSLICVPLPAIASLLHEHPAAARRFLSVVIQRLRGADELLSRWHIKVLDDIDEQR